MPQFLEWRMRSLALGYLLLVCQFGSVRAQGYPAKALETGEARAFVLKHGGKQMPFGPDDMARFHRAEYERMGRVARAAGIKPE
jgi:hypothetical protein